MSELSKCSDSPILANTDACNPEKSASTPSSLHSFTSFGDIQYSNSKSRIVFPFRPMAAPPLQRRYPPLGSRVNIPNDEASSIAVTRPTIKACIPNGLPPCHCPASWSTSANASTKLIGDIRVVFDVLVLSYVVRWRSTKFCKYRVR